jgi:hypothetical protein
MLIALLFLANSALADTYPVETVKNGFCVPVATSTNCLRDFATVDVSVIPESKANELFRAFKNDKALALNYLSDGCYARAHQMARAAEKDGILFGKVFSEGVLGIKPVSPHVPNDFQWGYHVAPIVYVRLANGSKQLRVIDPSLFDKPVSLVEWKKKLVSADEVRNANMLNEKLKTKNMLKVPAKGLEAYATGIWPNENNGMTYVGKITSNRFDPVTIRETYFGNRFQYFSRTADDHATGVWNSAEVQSSMDTLKYYRDISENGDFYQAVTVGDQIKPTQMIPPPGPPPMYLNKEVPLPKAIQ